MSGIHELAQKYPIIGLFAIIALILAFVGLYILTYLEEKAQKREQDKGKE